jgi:hypothetical protein
MFFYKPEFPFGRMPMNKTNDPYGRMPQSPFPPQFSQKTEDPYGRMPQAPKVEQPFGRMPVGINPMEQPMTPMAMDQLPQRMFGGPVKKKHPYLVGENGPEVVVPEDNGTVIPNDRTMAVAPQGDYPVTAESQPIGTEVTPRPYEPMPVNPNAPNQTQASINPTDATYPVPRTLQRSVNELLNKDYGRYTNPDTGEVTLGKDRDKKWSLKDKIGSALLGVAKGLAQGGPLGALVGGVEAGTDRNYLEKQQDNKDLRNLLPKLKQQQENEAFDMAQNVKQSQIDNYISDNERLRDELTRKTEADNVKKNYYEGILADKQKGRSLSAQQIDDLQTYRAWLMQNGDSNTQQKIRQIDETIRHNQAGEKQQSVNEQGRNSRAAANNATSVANTMTNGVNQNFRKQLELEFKKDPTEAKRKATAGFIKSYMSNNGGSQPDQDTINQYLANIGYN